MTVLGSIDIAKARGIWKKADDTLVSEWGLTTRIDEGFA
jgi:hypothetical protein